ncbi:MAG: 50S ribosomal protein L17 [Patescibacteria group bacterium]|nr:50S ribosomal protein L17 [Patescibacteria group bacterium]
MRHRVEKVKFRLGKDSNKMLIRKLLINFIERNQLTTTLEKAKLLKRMVDRIISRGKIFNEANKNYLLRYLMDPRLVKKIFEEISPSFSGIVGGYVRIRRVDFRAGDGAVIARIEWAHPLTKRSENKPVTRKPPSTELKLKKKDKQ